MSTSRTREKADGELFKSTGIDDNATSTAVTIDASENVGIGTVSPIAALDVTGTDAVGTLTSLVDTVTRASTIIRGSNHSNGYGIYMGYGNTSTDAQYIQSTLKTGSAAYPLLINPYGGNVGVGTSSPSDKAHIAGGGLIVDKTNNGYSGARFHDDSGGDYNSYIDLGRDQSGARLTIRRGGRVQGTTPWTNKTPTPIVSFANGGIAFGTDTAAANTLDDYEEGTFTMTINGGSSEPASLATTTGYYTKVGRQVTVSCNFANKNMAGYTGPVHINGLPFTAYYGSTGNVVVYRMAQWTDNLSCELSGSSGLVLLDVRSSSNWIYATHTGNTTSYLYLNYTYQTS